jgi:hypothetical protein
MAMFHLILNLSSTYLNGRAPNEIWWLNFKRCVIVLHFEQKKTNLQIFTQMLVFSFLFFLFFLWMIY